MIVFIKKEGMEKPEFFNASCYCNILLDSIKTKLQIEGDIVDLFSSKTVEVGEGKEPVCEPGERVYLTCRPTEMASELLKNSALYFAAAVNNIGSTGDIPSSRPSSKAAKRKK